MSPSTQAPGHTDLRHSPFAAIRH